MAETIKKNKLKIPLDIETTVEPEIKPEDNFTAPKPRKNLAEKFTEKKSKKEDKETAAPKAKKEVAPKVTIAERVKKVFDFFRMEQTQRITGLLFVFAAVYMAVSFTSYLLTWEADQDKVLGPGSVFFSPETRVQNWFGKMGALVSHLFMYKWFGVSSYLFVPLLLLSGISKAFQRPVFYKFVLWPKIVFGMLWSSVFLGFLFSDKLLFLGGGMGYILNQYLGGLMGGIGTLTLLTLSLIGFIFIAFNIRKKEVIAVLEPAVEEEPEMEVVPPVKEKEAVNKFTFEQPVKEPIKETIVPPLELAVEPKAGEKKTEEKIEELSLEVAPIVNDEKKDDLSLEIEPVKEEEIAETITSEKLVEQFGEYDPTLDLGSYQFPTLDLLNDYGNISTQINQEELNSNKDRIIDTLRNYGIEIDRIKATIGPTVTLYEIVPAAGVRISKIKNLEDDIALNLAALGIRIIAPIPGRGTIGIEVPNQNPEMVPMRNILASDKFQNTSFDLPIALGKTISNETFIADLSKMPHLLMAGATGQGKSVGLNAVLVSLLYKKHPSQIKFVLVDPKKVELTLFKKIERHFLAKLPNSEEAIITDNTKVVHTLNSLCIEMDNRYALLQDAQVRNLKEYNAKFIARKLNPNDGHKYLPYIVVVVDEFADLIMTAGKEVETPIARIAQLARAVGIHLIIATQRPSVNIITGIIKANFPARIAFRVTSKIDSRTILDAGGAEQLIGRGDMLLSTGNDLIRIQCAFVDTPEVEKITDFIGSQRGYSSAHLLPEYVDENSEGLADIDLSERDKMFDDAARMVVQHQQGSASLLQRKLKLGYNRAGRIIDQLEAAGIVGPFEGSKAREVMVKDPMSLEEKLKELNTKKDS
ncbi:MAG: DNA translocase FtsK 4TM domain-containing protein [Bacteroidia bacterium]